MTSVPEETLHPWSHSRAQIMATCERQYFFRYCAEGRWNSPDPRLRDLALLKQLKAIAMWKGDVIHQVLAEYFNGLKDAQPLPYAQLFKRAEIMAKAQWNFSVRGLYRKWGRRVLGQAFAAIFEHEYQMQDAESFDAALEHIRVCLINFRAMDAAHGISSAFLAGRDQSIEPPAWGDGATTFTISGIKVMVKVDLAFATADGRFLIFDWKTGKGDEDARPQLELYSVWAHLSLGYPLGSISAHEVSLLKGTVSCVRMSDNDLFFRIENIRRSADLIQALVGPDGASGPNLRDFNYAQHLSTCQRCPFQRVCRQFP